MTKLKKSLLPLLLALCLALSACGSPASDTTSDVTSEPSESTPISEEVTSPYLASSEEPEATSGTPSEVPNSESEVFIDGIPAFSGDPYVVINENEPAFTSDEITTDSFESYSPLDSLGRCGVAFACIGTDLMPTEDRGSIGQVKPTVWHTVKYDCVDGKYLYNRCHLIGYQLSGENANERNLITGTRYMNVDGMLPFENMVADYVQETGNHVMYRVTPYYDGNNLLANGVQVEAMSVEDDGDGILFNVYVYNAQPGVVIDYATGDSWLEGGSSTVTEEPVQNEPQQSTGSATYILNTNSKKFHYPDCSSVDQMNESNKQEFFGTRDEAIAQGYDPCGRCNP